MSLVEQAKKAEHKHAKRPEFVNGVRTRMPENYSFDTRRKNWKPYEKYSVLRTDAVWEKTQLKDWYRLYYKVVAAPNAVLLLQQGPDALRVVRARGHVHRPDGALDL